MDECTKIDPTLSCHILILGKNKTNSPPSFWHARHIRKTRPCPPPSPQTPSWPVWIWFRCDHPILLLFNVKFLLQQTSKLNLLKFRAVWYVHVVLKKNYDTNNYEQLNTYPNWTMCVTTITSNRQQWSEKPPFSLIII